MTWSVAYCTSGDSDLARTEVETEHALRQWVAQVERDRKMLGSIFDEKQYINTRYSKQWGTDYWWLTVVGKTNGEDQDEVQMGGRQVPARVLDRRAGDRSDPNEERDGDVSRLSEGPSLCPTCGQEVKA